MDYKRHRPHLQESAVPPEDLIAVELGHLQEAVRGKDDGVVGEVGIADAEVLLDALHGGGQVHGDAGEGLGGGHLLLDALPLLHQLVVAACRHLLQSTGSAASTRAARTEGEHLTIRNRKHIHQMHSTSAGFLSCRVVCNIDSHANGHLSLASSITGMKDILTALQKSDEEQGNCSSIAPSVM